MRRPLLCALITLAAAQVAFSLHARPFTPNLSIVPPVPRAEGVQAIALGDTQFYFRMLALRIQNSGDMFGRFTPLKHYDFSKLSQWFHLLDTLDSRSHMIPSMAAHYFSQTQHGPDVRYMVDYLYDHASQDAGRKWWWLIQALYLSMHKLKDMELAAKVATPLLHPDVPAWAQQMLAVVHEKRGEMDHAMQIMETIRTHAKQITDADLAYMTYFVQERLRKLEEMPAGPGPSPHAP